MHITRLSIQHFRNHLEATADFAPHINIITGPNGAGKTSLIDAIHYLCMTRSFVSGSDRFVVTSGESYFMLQGHFRGEIRSEIKVGCSYARRPGKRRLVNDCRLDRSPDAGRMLPAGAP